MTEATRTFDPIPGPDTCIVPGDKLALVGSDLDVARLVAEYGQGGV